MLRIFTLPGSVLAVLAATALMALALVASQGGDSVSAAAPVGSVTGGGSMAPVGYPKGFALGGNVSMDENGNVTGQFQVVLHQSVVPSGSICHWDTFSNFVITGNLAVFDGTGVCYSFEFDSSLAVSNRFAITDNGEGPGVDTIDVNYYGPIGIALSGYIDTGNFRVRGGN